MERIESAEKTIEEIVQERKRGKKIPISGNQNEECREINEEEKEE